MIGKRLLRSAFHLRTRHAHPPLRNNRQHFSMYYAEHFVLRSFRLFLHCCELHARPWLFGMQLAAVCMSRCGSVHSICTHQPKAIWVWYAVHCESVVAYSSHAVQTICGRPLYMIGKRLLRSAFHLRTRHAHPPLRNNRQHFSMYYAEHFVLRSFRLFLHCCELHARPWLFGMQLAAVCMSRCGSVHSICTHQPKAIWVWYAVHCESVVAYSSHAVQTICGRPLYMMGKRLLRSAFHLRTRHAHPPLRNNRQHFSMYYAEHFVLRSFRLFLHCCELHARPWLFGMQLAAVCMSRCGSVHSICTHQPKAIWVWYAVHCESVVAYSSHAVQTICGRPLYMIGKRLLRSAFHLRTRHAHPPLRNNRQHFSMYYAEHFVLRSFRLFLHCCELHARPWLFGMQLAAVCMSRCGSVHSICTHQPKAIWVWYAVHCESVVAYSSHAVQTICGTPLYMIGKRLLRSAFHLRTRHAHPPLRNNRQHFSMYYAEHFVLQLAAVCMSRCGS